MVKEVYISYPCITMEYGGYNMYPSFLLGRTLTYTYIHFYKKTLKQKKSSYKWWVNPFANILRVKYGI